MKRKADYTKAIGTLKHRENDRTCSLEVHEYNKMKLAVLYKERVKIPKDYRWSG
jgi:hypothetical protein